MGVRLWQVGVIFIPTYEVEIFSINMLAEISLPQITDHHSSPATEILLIY